MKNKIYYILFVLYLLILAVFLQREVRLEHEFEIIMNDFKMEQGYRMFGFPTAYMPPLYSYYLLLCKTVFSFMNWTKISCVIQSVIYFFSLFYLFKTFLKNNLFKPGIVLFFCSVLFFPPIFFGSVSISSFSLSVSILCVFFALLYRIYNSKEIQRREVIYIALVSISGLYIRYEFLFIIVLSGLIYLFLRKIKLINFITILFFIFIAYLPWTVRNYLEIGKFTYATSLNYNFAKGYSEKYVVFSSYNFPYDPHVKKNLSINVLYKEFNNEREIDEHLAALNKEFMQQHPVLFLKLSVQKLAINFLQYFPDYNGISKHRIYIFYSIFFVIFQGFLIVAMTRLKSAKHDFLLIFTISFYLFFLFFYSIAPMPRYLLLLYPVFFVIIIKSFQTESILNSDQKKIAS